MLGSFWNAVSDPAAQEVARWYPIFGDLEKYHKIKVQNLNESRKDYRVVGDNMDTQGNEVFLRTRFPYKYTVNSYIYYRRVWYEITQIDTRNFPAGGYGMRQEYTLHLLERNYGRDFVGTH